MNEYEMTFSRILFCTDFSPNAERAFRYAVKAAKHNGARLYILHVMASAEDFLAGDGGLPEPDAQFWKGYVENEEPDFASKITERLEHKVKASYLEEIPEGLSYEICYRIGNPAQQIIDFAAENEIGLAIVGRQGASGAVKSLLFGNVATKVAREISCPVLVIPPK